MNPVEWALAYDGGYRWGVLTSNDAECFNSVLKGFMAHLPDKDEARTVVTCRRGDSGLWEHPLDHRVLQCLLRAGFYGVYRIGHIRLDHPLTTAFVERWRTETHTFHFPIREAIVTLQDVSVLYGLRIDGQTITRADPSLTREQWIALCAELLGVAPTPADLQAGRLRVRSQNLLKLMYLPLLRGIDAIDQYSWGAAALACLYRMLCRASQVGAKEIRGPFVLLQIWVWERLIRIASSRRQVVAPGEVPIGQGDMQLPAGS
ncbi:serine/threonine-protein phosphatase 7 long form homolog [Camellia sinensis]|uniref:serine/threonine-protein phosphatase 7 long form homolog n=1 Tax=Camellia sinensis TaxID=4442 RepID=UPI001036BCE3|nr:serine/threonine-protein phosphatase 7 long form homolog [Camellia sinensis]